MIADSRNVKGELYQLTFPNGKSYFGITNGHAKRRFLEHSSAARTSKDRYAVHNAILKYGEANVIVRAIVVANYDYLKELEKRAIATFNTQAPNGYNLTIGGEGLLGHVFTDAHRAKISASKTGKKASQYAIEKNRIGQTGRKHSDETKSKMSLNSKRVKITEERKNRLRELRIGSVMSLETRTKISSSLRGRKMSPEAVEKSAASRRGKPMTEERKAHLSAINKGKKQSEETIEKMRKASTGKKQSAETIAKRKATMLLKKILSDSGSCKSV